MDDGSGGGFNLVAGGDISLYLRMSIKVQKLDETFMIGSYDAHSDSFAKEIIRG